MPVRVNRQDCGCHQHERDQQQVPCCFHHRLHAEEAWQRNRPLHRKGQSTPEKTARHLSVTPNSTLCSRAAGSVFLQTGFYSLPIELGSEVSSQLVVIGWNGRKSAILDFSVSSACGKQRPLCYCNHNAYCCKPLNQILTPSCISLDRNSQMFRIVYTEDVFNWWLKLRINIMTLVFCDQFCCHSVI